MVTRRTKEVRTPEQVWLDNMKKMLAAIKGCKAAQVNRAQMLADTEQLRELHVVELEHLRTAVLSEEMTDAVLTVTLREMRARQRWIDHYDGCISQMKRQGALDDVTVQYALARLSEEPYPGESTLKEDPDEQAKTSSAPGTGDLVEKPEATAG